MPERETPKIHDLNEFKKQRAKKADQKELRSLYGLSEDATEDELFDAMMKNPDLSGTKK